MNRVGDIVQEEGGVGRLGERLTQQIVIITT